MSDIPGDLKFMKSHEWARVEGDGKVTVGISDHAQGFRGAHCLFSGSNRNRRMTFRQRSRLPVHNDEAGGLLEHHFFIAA